MATIITKMMNEAAMMEEAPNNDIGTIWVWETRLDDLEKKISYLKRKGANIEMKDTGETRKAKAKDGFYYLQHKIHITGDIIRYRGWKLRGAFVPTPDKGNLYTPMVGDDYMPSLEEINREHICHHCQKHIQRKFYYLLENASGEQITVGTSCLREFTGGLSPVAAAASLQAATIGKEVSNWTPRTDERIFDSKFLLSESLKQKTVFPIIKKPGEPDEDLIKDFMNFTFGTAHTRVERFLMKDELKVIHLQVLEDIILGYFNLDLNAKNNITAFREANRKRNAKMHKRQSTNGKEPKVGDVLMVKCYNGDSIILDGGQYWLAFTKKCDLHLGEIIRLNKVDGNLYNFDKCDIDSDEDDDMDEERPG